MNYFSPTDLSTPSREDTAYSRARACGVASWRDRDRPCSGDVPTRQRSSESVCFLCPIASVDARAADSDARASVMASDAAERCAEVLRAGARGLGGAEARARAVALAEEVGHDRTTERPNERFGTRARARETRRDDAEEKRR